MKTQKNIFKTLLFFAISATLILSSCSKEDEQGLNNTDNQTTFSKEITLQDESGENSIVMRVSSDDPSLVENYSKDNFKITAVPFGKTTAEVLNTIYDTNDEASSEDLENDADVSTVNAPEVNFETISKNLKDGIKNVAITFSHPESNDDRASWKIYTHTSDINIDHVAFITRHSVTRRVYVGLEYKATSASSWSSIISAWDKLKNKEVINEYKSTCYQFKMRVKTKKSSAYTYSFEE